MAKAGGSFQKEIDERSGGGLGGGGGFYKMKKIKK